MRQLLLLLYILGFNMLAAQEKRTGDFHFNQDIGSPRLQGAATYDASKQQYHLKGAGYNIWFGQDEFHYLYNELEGDFILTANFAFLEQGVDAHRKTGWMVRASTDPQSVHFSTALHGDGLTLAQWRPLKGAHMRDPEDQFIAPKKGYEILQLERKGSSFIFRAAHPGEPLQFIGKKELESLNGPVLAGLFVCSHNPNEVEEAQIWNVRMDFPLSKAYQPGGHQQLGCRLESLNVQSGKRQIIFQKNDRFEAPNWMPDGEHLLFNMEGGIYTIGLNGGAPKLLNTDFADQNNNDHGISFDGKMLAISHHRENMPSGGSTIYVLDLEGGKPHLVTEKTPSYWHGWSPDGKAVIYVAKRSQGGPYNLYQKSIDGGEEKQLTDIVPGEHVDGCEYSPDGQYIYYNGNHTGTMQIWRMKPDGSGREQITFDESHDWFPHISPDGKWLVYLSYPTDIQPNSHPFCQQVSLKLMSLEGGGSRVIAYLYGGQGTINVPSWSPDSRFIAFVSNYGRSN